MKKNPIVTESTKRRLQTLAGILSENYLDQLAQEEFGMNYDQLGPGEKEWCRDEADNRGLSEYSLDEPHPELILQKAISMIRQFWDIENERAKTGRNSVDLDELDDALGRIIDIYNGMFPDERPGGI